MALYMIAYELHEGEDYGRPNQSDQGSPFGRIVAHVAQSWIDLVRHQQGSCGPNPQFIETACIRWG